MKPPRLSIATSMAAIFILAAHLAAGRAFYTLGSVYADQVVGVFAMTALLMIGMLIAIRDLVRRRRSGTFLPGFLAFGWATVFGYVCCFLFSPERLIGPYVQGVLFPLAPVVGHLGPDFGDVAWTACIAAVFLVPQLLVALVGGLLSTRLGVAIVRG